MKYFFLLLALFTNVAAHSQCSEFDNLLKKGDNHLKGTKPNYQEAINAYTAAILACTERASEAKQRLAKMVSDINKLKENAVLAEKEAKKAKNEALEALADLEQKNADVVRLILQNADRDILNLRYEDALEKIKAAASLGALKTEVAKHYLEIAFWHGETGNIQRSTQLLDSIAAYTQNTAVSAHIRQIPSDIVAARNNLREAMKMVDAQHFDSLYTKKYYPDMVFVQGGKFTMGCDQANDPDCSDDETPHEQAVSSFRIARTETTVWQYALYCAATGVDIKDYLESTWSDPGDNPVVYVSWFDAALYSNWINNQHDLEPVYVLENKRTGDWVGDNYDVSVNPNAKRGYRLPSEAEWEYAAGGGVGTRTKYAGTNDNEQLKDFAWYYENSGSRTRSVGTRKANLLGLHDMSGNVWEWCWDWYEAYPTDQKPEYTGPESGSSRVFRGGSWRSYPQDCRVSNRRNYSPGERDNGLGFRLARTP